MISRELQKLKLPPLLFRMEIKMATYVFHVTGLLQAYHIAAAGEYDPLSTDPLNTDACLNMFATAVRGEPVPYSPDRQIVADTGAALILEWSGPEETMRSWSETPPRPNVLYHQPWHGHRSEEPLESPVAYYRSLVFAGTRQNLSIVGFKLDSERVAQAWIRAELPDAVMGLWRFAPALFRKIFAGYGVVRMEKVMNRLVAPYGKPLMIAGNPQTQPGEPSRTIGST